MKIARTDILKALPFEDPAGAPFVYGLPDPALRLLHGIDRDAGGLIEIGEEVTNSATRDRYIVSSLIEESITSSQLEGASTTVDVAKKMLRSGRAPMDRSGCPPKCGPADQRMPSRAPDRNRRRTVKRSRRVRGLRGHAFLIAALTSLSSSPGCTVPHSDSGTLPAAIESRVDSIMTEYRRKRSVPGLSLTIVRRGRILLSRGYGWTDQSRSVPVTGETAFELGSIKKPITAAAILRMAERKQIRLDDAVGKWVASIRVPGPPVRIRDMLNQVSGLPEADDDEIITRLDFEPGTRWAYSNTNFDRLDAVVEAADGRSFARFLADEFATPGAAGLAMCDADAPRPPGLARGHTARNGVIETTEDACWLRGSTRALAVWADALFAGRILGAESLEAMTAPYRLRDGSVGEYGYGLFLRPYRTMRRFSHTGHVDGFTAAFGHYPDSGTTIAVAGNSDALFDPDGVEVAVAAALFGLPPEKPRALRLGDNERFAGTWDGGSVWFRLETKGPDSLRLVMHAPGRPGTTYFSTDLVRVDTSRYVGADSPAAIGAVFGMTKDGDQATGGRILAVGIPWDVRRVR